MVCHRQIGAKSGGFRKHGAVRRKQEHHRSHVFHKPTSGCEGGSRHVGKVVCWSSKSSFTGSLVKGNEGDVGEKGKSLCSQMMVCAYKLCKNYVGCKKSLLRGFKRKTQPWFCKCLLASIWSLRGHPRVSAGLCVYLPQVFAAGSGGTASWTLGCFSACSLSISLAWFALECLGFWQCRVCITDSVLF